MKENGSFGSYCILFVTVTATFPIVGAFCVLSLCLESILADEALLPASLARLVRSRLLDNEVTLSFTLKLDSLLLFKFLSSDLLSLLESLSLLCLLPLSSDDCRLLPPGGASFPLSVLNGELNSDNSLIEFVLYPDVPVSSEDVSLVFRRLRLSSRPWLPDKDGSRILGIL